MINRRGVEAYVFYRARGRSIMHVRRLGGQARQEVKNEGCSVDG